MCSDAPEGHEHWTLRLLADKVVESGLVPSLSHETVRLRLKKTPDRFLPTNNRRYVSLLRCNLREQATQDRAISQSPQEDPTSAIHVPIHSEPAFVPDDHNTAQVRLDAAVPTARLLVYMKG